MIRFRSNLTNPAEREAVQRFVRQAFGDRQGNWDVLVYEPQESSEWQILITGPNAFKWENVLQGAVEQTPEFVGMTVREILPKTA